jgi:hypothetical protein
MSYRAFFEFTFTVIERQAGPCRESATRGDGKSQIRTKDSLIVFMAFSPGYKSSEDRRWKILYQTAVWCIWKAFLSHSFASAYKLWHQTAAVTNFRNEVNRQILADRAACLTERHWNREINPMEFEIRWGQGPSKMSIIRGPDCLLRQRPIEPDRDHESEWEIVE